MSDHDRIQIERLADESFSPEERDAIDALERPMRHADIPVHRFDGGTGVLTTPSGEELLPVRTVEGPLALMSQAVFLDYAERQREHGLRSVRDVGGHIRFVPEEPPA